jgi:DNA mismatch repair protein MSH5
MLTWSSHMLQELTVSSFVPNNTYIAGGRGSGSSTEDSRSSTPIDERFKLTSSKRHRHPHEQSPSMLVLTGPNYSGKSVYLKQVALIVFMAHVGSFVPAESATVGLTDKILSRVTTRETVSRMQSAFMLDLQQISLALSLATRRSLLIIDEFGKGTESSDGAGLACAVLEYLLDLGTERPKVIGATHFHGEEIVLRPSCWSAEWIQRYSRWDFSNHSQVSLSVTWKFVWKQKLLTLVIKSLICTSKCIRLIGVGIN